MPRPARSTGTSSGGLASRVPSVAVTGVCIGYVSTGKGRAASYTSMVVSSCSAARNDRGVGRASRMAVSRDLGERMVNDEYVHDRSTYRVPGAATRLTSASGRVTDYRSGA